MVKLRCRDPEAPGLGGRSRNREHGKLNGNLSSRVYNAVSSVRQLDLETEDSNVFFKTLLGLLIDVTGSEFGFIGEPRFGKDDRPYLVVYAVADNKKSGGAFARISEMLPRILEISSAEIPIGVTVASGEPVFDNNPDHDSASPFLKVLPELRTLMCLPFLVGGQLVGTACLVNRLHGYDTELLEELQPLITCGAQGIAALKSENRLRLAEEALRASEVRFRTVADFSYDWESWWSNDGSLFYVSPSFERITGYTTESLVADPGLIERIAHPEDAELVSSHFRRHCEEIDGPIEFRIITKNGREQWIEHHCRVVHNHDGTVMGRRATNRNITAQKRAEKDQVVLQAEVLRSAEEWQATFDAVDSMILVLDADRRVRRMNRATSVFLTGVGIFGVGTSIEEFPLSQPWTAIRDLVDEVVGQSPAVRHVFDESTSKAWEISCTAVRGQDREHELFTILARDVTQIVELRDALRRSEAMSAMGELVGGVAHEVRNPVFALSALTEAFRQRFGEREEFCPYFDAIDNQLGRMKLFMDQLLDYGRAADLERDVVSFCTVVFDAIALCDQKLIDQQVAVENHVDENLGDVRIDRMRMTTVLTSILTNAIQFTAPGGVVSIGSDELDREDRTWIEIRVRDFGMGFNPEDLPHVFEPFFSRRSGGTGLGLAIAHRVVESHGGYIEALNAADGGGLVIIRLPCAD